MKILKTQKLIILLIFFLISVSMSVNIFAQGKTKWMAAGSLHNWYSEFGCEIEHGLYPSQQWGMRWPASHKFQDMQAAKAFWIGVANFTDSPDFGGDTYQHKVVHVGPRVSGQNEFFPVEWKMISRFDKPSVFVDGLESFQLPADNDAIDPDLPYDRMIYNVINTQVGATVKRKIYQFSQGYHDNYIINEVTVVNTGNVDDDADIELPNTTLEDLYLLWQFRWAVSYNTRYTIGNATGWGINTMCDVRGDGLGDRYGTPDEDVRGNYAWHGKYPPFTAYDNLGAPIWTPSTAGGLLSATDTIGRLGSAQFIGVVTLHADAGPNDHSDDFSQPSTTSYEGSDMDFTSNNDPFNPVKMTKEYTEVIQRGHRDRHAYVIEPAGKFTEPTGNPSIGASGGYSNSNGYGPYTLAPGDSIRIVWAEGSSGLSWENCVEIGRQFKQGEISAIEKNEWVMTGYDSLFKTFRRALANWNGGNGFTIPRSPNPPSIVNVNSGGDRIQLSWEHSGEGPTVRAFEVYRARGDWDSTYNLIHTGSPSDVSYDDTEVIRGVDYYYYVQAVGDAADNNGGGNTPSGVALRSNRMYSQSFDPANLKRAPGENIADFRVVPNPYIISADENNLLFPGRKNRLAFFDIPGVCKIQVFTELGELIYELEHTNGSGDEFWDLNTSSNQLVVSGIYIVIVTDLTTNKTEIQKFAVIR